MFEVLKLFASQMGKELDDDNLPFGQCNEKNPIPKTPKVSKPPGLSPQEQNRLFDSLRAVISNNSMRSKTDHSGEKPGSAHSEVPLLSEKQSNHLLPQCEADLEKKKFGGGKKLQKKFSNAGKIPVTLATNPSRSSMKGVRRKSSAPPRYYDEYQTSPHSQKYSRATKSYSAPDGRRYSLLKTCVDPAIISLPKVLSIFEKRRDEFIKYLNLLKSELEDIKIPSSGTSIRAPTTKKTTKKIKARSDKKKKKLKEPSKLKCKICASHAASNQLPTYKESHTEMDNHRAVNQIIEEKELTEASLPAVPEVPKEPVSQPICSPDASIPTLTEIRKKHQKLKSSPKDGYMDIYSDVISVAKC